MEYSGDPDVPRLISLDYDETYTCDKLFWNEFIQLCQKYGHEVICVTARNEMKDPIKDLSIDVIYTDGYNKREYTENLDIYVDIWIDDMPHII